MDFFVSDTTDDTEARQIMSRGTKEYSVLLSSDELEKMAEDDSYYNSRVKDIDGAVSMSKQINGQFGFDSAYGKENGTQIAQIGIRLNDDGTTTYFVELEKLSEKQKERIENAKEKKAEDAKRQINPQRKQRLSKNIRAGKFHGRVAGKDQEYRLGQHQRGDTTDQGWKI